ncbi:MAG: PilZ domain-containing protein [Candidatus Sulfotelmatobacter sp.]
MKGSTDLVVLDWEGEASSEFLRELRQAGKWKKPTIVAITPSDCPIPGAHVVLKKPVTAESGTKSLKAAYAMMLQDYRLHARYPLMMPVNATDGENRRIAVTVTDIGDGGVGLSTREQLICGDVLSFRALLPGTPRELLLEVRVLWTREFGRVGCEFLRIPPVDLSILHDWLKSKIRVKKPLAAI